MSESPGAGDATWQQPGRLPFQDKIALITGSGRGIGRAIALHFARLGADIMVNFFRNRRAAQQTAEAIGSLGRRAWIVRADVGKIEGIEHLCAEAERLIGEEGLPPGLNFLIHNAASGYNRPALEQKPKGWDWTMSINARALLFLAQKVVPMMEARCGGAIVSISSPGSFTVLPDYIVVGASKAALESLTRYLSIELARHQIVVNAVSPGMVLTDALSYFDAVRKEEKIIERATANTPAGRLVTPEDVAGVVAFLCSPEASMIRGQTILVDGGYTLVRR
jgi:enoyl-[acyl-carrier protein] reductase III